MARPAAKPQTSAPTIAAVPVGGYATLLDDVPVRGGNEWLRAGDTLRVTGSVSGGWRIVRARRDDGRWSEPYTVLDSARAVVAPEALS